MRYLFVLIVLSVSVSALGQSTKELAMYDFEKGTKGWERRGQNVQIKVTKDTAANGEKSLHVRSRRENWQGAQLNLTNKLKRGVWYVFTASVKLDGSDSDKVIKLSMQRGDNQWDNLAAASTGSSAWTKISGKFRTAGDPYLLVYVESEDPSVSFFIDDFKIEEVLPIEQKGTLMKSDFQDKTAQEWLLLGPEAEMFSSNDGSNIFLKVDGRIKDWHGLARDITSQVVTDRKYIFSIDVKLPDGQSPIDISLSVRETDSDGDSKIVEVAKAKKVGSSEWVTITGEYRSKDDKSDYLLLVQGGDETTPFFIDNFEMKVKD